MLPYTTGVPFPKQSVSMRGKFARLCTYCKSRLHAKCVQRTQATTTFIEPTSTRIRKCSQAVKRQLALQCRTSQVKVKYSRPHGRFQTCRIAFSSPKSTSSLGISFSFSRVHVYKTAFKNMTRNDPPINRPTHSIVT